MSPEARQALYETQLESANAINSSRGPAVDRTCRRPGNHIASQNHPAADDRQADSDWLEQLVDLSSADRLASSPADSTSLAIAKCCEWLDKRL